MFTLALFLLVGVASAANCIVTTPVGTGDDKGTAIAVQADGKILLAGYALVGASEDFALVRYNPDFSLDLSFGTNGIVTTDFFGAQDRAEAIAIGSGKIYLAGHATNGGNRDLAVARYNLNGSLDTSFGGTGKVVTTLPGGFHDELEGIAVQSDGKLVVAGFSQRATTDYVVARYTSAGALDTATFASPNGYFLSPNGATADAATEVAIQPDGRIVIGGWANNGTNDDFAAVRFTTAGALDPTFNGGAPVLVPIGAGRDRAESMALQSDGKIVLAGSVRAGWDLFGVARLNTDGSLDTTTFNPTGAFGNAPNLAGRVTVDFTAAHDAAFGVVVQTDGKIVLGGWTNWDGVGTAVDLALTRHNADGSLDGSFGAGGKVTTTVGINNDWIDNLALQPDGRIVAGGYARIGANDDLTVVRYHTDGTLDARCAGCAPLYTTEGAGTITVTSPDSFEMTFDVLAGGAINKFYDLAEDPSRTYDLAGGTNPPGLHNHGMRLSGPVFYNSTNNDTSSRLVLLEATPSRVRVRQQSYYEDDATGTLLPGVKAQGDYSVYPAGRTAVRWNRSAALPVTMEAEYAEIHVRYTSGVPPLDSWAVSSETDATQPNPGTDRFFLLKGDTGGLRTDFLHVLYRDWIPANGHFGTADDARWNPSIPGGRINAYWYDTYLPAGTTLPAGSSESWNLLTYFKPTSFVDQTDPAVTSRMLDYRTPDSLSISVGGPWLHASESTGGGDDFNETEAAYVLTMDPALGLRFDLDGLAIPRRDPVFKIRQWRSFSDPPSVTLEGAPLSNDVSFKADVKPIARAHRTNILAWHCTLETGTSCTPPDLDVGGTGGITGGSIVSARYGNGFSATTSSDSFTAGSADFNSGSGAVEFWFRPNYPSTDLNPHMLWHNMSGGSDHFRFEHTGGNLVFEICVNGTLATCAGGTPYVVTVTGANYRWSQNEWVHLRTEWITGGSSAIRVFLNGTQVGSTSPFSAVGLTNGTTTFGSCFVTCPGGGGSRYADGTFDEPHIYIGLGSTGNPETLGYAGLTSSLNEYLGSPTRNASLFTTAVDGFGRGMYIYFGSDSQFRGLNVALAAAGAGSSPNVQWDYWNGANWTDLESGFGFTDQTANLTVANGTIYWTGDPAGWAPYSVNGGTDLFYVRAHLASGDFSTTTPVEGLIKTDILLFQYCGDVTLDAQTFEFAVPTPTAVELVSFEAEAGDGAVTLRWQTASELRNLGFHLYRGLSPSGPLERITKTPIPGLGSSPSGASYQLLDSGLRNGTTYFYELEDIETTGRTKRHGPVSARPVDGGASSSATGVRIAYGRPEANELRILNRTLHSLVLELRTEGFYALPHEDGTVILEAPGLEILEALPVKRSWVDVASGLGVRVASIDAVRVERFQGLRVADMDTRIVSSRSGVAELRSNRTRREQSGPRPWARLLERGYQGDVKKALVELAPLQESEGALMLARRLVVRLDFAGREETPEQAHGRERRRREDAAKALHARLVARERGLYGVRFEDLAGRNARAVKGSLRLRRGGEDVPYHVLPASDRFGPGSTLYFASEGAEANPYDGEAIYELSLDGPGKRMSVIDGRPAGSGEAFYWQQVEREENAYYQATLLAPPDPFVWDVLLAPITRTYAFELSALAPGGGTASLSVTLLGASDALADPDHHLAVSVNGALVGESSFDGLGLVTLTFEVPTSLLHEGANELALENVGDTDAPYSMVMLERFDLVYPRRPVATGGFLEGRWEGTALVEGVGATPLVVERDYDVTRWVANVEGARFAARKDETYWVVAADAVRRPEIRSVSRPKLDEGGADYLVVGPAEFLDAARSLLEHRREQGLRVLSVPVERVFDEFGFGERRPEAIREFLRHAYHAYRPRPRYVVLLGDGTYDFKDVLKTGVPNHVPPLLVKTSYLWTASDPTYAAVNGLDDLPDLAIGRIPAASADDARRLAEKIVSWEKGFGHLDGRAVLVADDPDRGGDFVRSAGEVASSLLFGREVERIYLSELGTGETRARVRDAFDRGASIVSYLGHGGIHLWASENLLDIDGVSSLALQAEQPLLLTMNCLNGYFHFPHFDALSERLLKAEGKGVIAAFSPTGLSLHDSADLFHRALLRELVSGGHVRLGDAVLAAQVSYAGTGAFPELLRIYHLFGDPALRIR
jgi:uncharacterized delta-60 repeat protein